MMDTGILAGQEKTTAGRRKVVALVQPPKSFHSICSSSRLWQRNRARGRRRTSEQP